MKPGPQASKAKDNKQHKAGFLFQAKPKVNVDRHIFTLYRSVTNSHGSLLKNHNKCGKQVKSTKLSMLDNVQLNMTLNPIAKTQQVLHLGPSP